VERDRSLEGVGAGDVRPRVQREPPQALPRRIAELPGDPHVGALVDDAGVDEDEEIDPELDGVERKVHPWTRVYRAGMVAAR